MKIGKCNTRVKMYRQLEVYGFKSDNLSSNLKIDQFVNLKKYYSGNQLRLLLRKCIYPYDYVDCLKKLDETSLPPKDAFILNSRVRALQMKTTNMLKQFGMNLILSQ